MDVVLLCTKEHKRRRPCVVPALPGRYPIWWNVREPAPWQLPRTCRPSPSSRSSGVEVCLVPYQDECDSTPWLGRSPSIRKGVSKQLLVSVFGMLSWRGKKTKYQAIIIQGLASQVMTMHILLGTVTGHVVLGEQRRECYTESRGKRGGTALAGGGVRISFLLLRPVIWTRLQPTR